ncbi:hypothetical protein [Aeromonas salmonicida]|uniref:hypothetical protein n=1 Tax=Aeromonas salmonicida TaxID=645 RepID=UPI0038BCB40F
MSQSVVSNKQIKPFSPEEVNKHWDELGSCQFSTANSRTGALTDWNVFEMAPEQVRSIAAIGNVEHTIRKSSGWKTALTKLTPNQARWCEASLCVQLAEMAPDVRYRTSDNPRKRKPWGVGHQQKRGPKPTSINITDPIVMWLTEVMNEYKPYESLPTYSGGLWKTDLSEGDSAHWNEISRAAKILIMLKESDDDYQKEISHALVQSIKDAKEKLSHFNIGTKDTKESAIWILLLKDAWGLGKVRISGEILLG